MAELEYSPEAIDVLKYFHGVDIVLLMEGEDDVPFWELIFETFSDFTFYSHPVGGKPELKKYIELIRQGSLDAVAALDRDYDFLDSNSSTCNVLTTFGYSIENSLIGRETMKHVVTHLARVSPSRIPDSDIDDWLSRLSADVEDLVFADMENQVKLLGLEVAGDNCSRFAKSKRSAYLCRKKIDAMLTTLNCAVSDEFRGKIIERMSAEGLSNLDVTRGHFLFSAAYRFVLITVEGLRGRITISTEALWGAFLMALRATFGAAHPHYDYYRNSVRSIVIGAR